MALMEGPAKANVLKNYIEKDAKNQTYVNLKLGFDGEEQTLFTRIYITEKSAGIARAALRKVGFDLDSQKLSDLDQNEDFLQGAEVEVILVQNGKYMNANIPIGRQKAPKDAIDAAQKMLDSAKKSDSDPDGDIPF